MAKILTPLTNILSDENNWETHVSYVLFFVVWLVEFFLPLCVA